MGNVIANYETVFIINPDIGDDATNAAVERFTELIAANGTVIEKAEWGRRRLAYPINDYEEGYYVLINFSCGTEFLKELDRIYNITDSILRSIVIRK